jgi:hypothetical protein
MHNTHIWPDENPHAVRDAIFTTNFAKCLAWNYKWTTYWIPHYATTAKWRSTFKFLNDVFLQIKLDANMWHRHDGAPYHNGKFSCMLDKTKWSCSVACQIARSKSL